MYTARRLGSAKNNAEPSAVSITVAATSIGFPEVTEPVRLKIRGTATCKYFPNEANTPAIRPIKAYITAISPEAPLKTSDKATVVPHTAPESVPPYFDAVRISATPIIWPSEIPLKLNPLIPVRTMLREAKSETSSSAVSPPTAFGRARMHLQTKNVPPAASKDSETILRKL